MAGLALTWWSAVSGYFIAAMAVFRGDVGALPVIALAGLVCLVAGVALIVLWKVRHAARTLWLVAAALLSPLAIALSNSILGWVGMLFAVLAGAIFLVVGTAVFAGNADRRIPVWLIGAFSMALAAYCATVGGAFVSLT
ncbi:MAG TPA: hypothetical protein VHA07_06685 [Devosia sp.]|nr:hypothetical protein [Devosia sp.]